MYIWGAGLNRRGFKEFKNYLLSSGIPLEVHISNLLAKHGWIVLEEIPFYLENQITGEVEESTAEIIGRDTVKPWGKRKKIPDIHFDVNVECKYRRPSTCWLFFGSSRALGFAQDKPKHLYTPSDIPTFYPSKSRKFEEKEFKLYSRFHDVIWKHLSDYSIASRVVQIPGEGNKKFSREIIYNTFGQVMKSSINWKKTNIPEMIKRLAYPFISIIFPCVVTNSKILYFENVNLEIIQKLKFEKLGEICKEVKKVIFLYQIPQNLQFKPKFFLTPINFLFIPVVSHDSFIPEIEKLRKMLHRIKI